MSILILSSVVLITYLSVVSSAADIPKDFPIDVKNFIWKKPKNFPEAEWNKEPINGYNFHVYFFSRQSKQQKTSDKIEVILNKKFSKYFS